MPIKKARKTFVNGVGMLFTLLLLIMLTSAAAFAADRPTVTVSQAEAERGERVSLAVSISSNPGINTFTFGFDYDESRLELEKVRKSSGLGGTSDYSKRFVWMDSADTLYNGEVLTLTFLVRSDAPEGRANVAVTFSDGDISNYNEEEVKFVSEPGYINVRNGTGTTADTTTRTGGKSDAATKTTDNTGSKTTEKTTGGTARTTGTTAAGKTTASTKDGSGTTGSSTTTSRSKRTRKTTTRTTTTIKPRTTTTLPTTSPSSMHPHTERLAGTDRIGTAIAICRKGWSEAKCVLVANAYSYPDALAGATLSGKYDAPMLLTDRDRVNSTMLSEIKRLGAEKVIILGGYSAVSLRVEQALSSTGAKVTRISGDNRAGTAANIARELCPDGCSAVYLVSSANFADALSVSPIAAIQGRPILYVDPEGVIPSETFDALAELGCVKAYIIGGEGAIGSPVDFGLELMEMDSERVYGDDRYMTSLAVCRKFAEDIDTRSVALATGADFPDALAGACFAAKKKMPVVLVNDDIVAQNAAGSAVNAQTPEDQLLKSYLVSGGTQSLYVFGGAGAVSDAAVNTADGWLSGGRTPVSSDLPSWLYSCGGE